MDELENRCIWDVAAKSLEEHRPVKIYEVTVETFVVFLTD